MPMEKLFKIAKKEIGIRWRRVRMFIPGTLKLNPGTLSISAVIGGRIIGRIFRDIAIRINYLSIKTIYKYD
jgi:hypothetical protein